MNRKNVSSSNIKSVGYDKNTKVLEVEFHNSGLYHYKDVPENTADELVNATSVGKFFNMRVKNAFKCKKGSFKKIELPNIYICGKAGAGKSVLADYIIREHGYKRSKFAYPVYNIAYDYFGMTDKDRNLLQTIGTDVGRDELNNNLWVNRFAEDMKIVKRTRELLKLEPVHYVSDDVRFPNEHETLRKEGWLGIYLDVSDELCRERLVSRDGTAQESTLTHKAETSLDEFSDKLIRLDSSVSLPKLCSLFDDLLKTLED